MTSIPHFGRSHCTSSPTLFLALLCALLAGCVGATTQLPPVSPEAIEIEKTKQLDLVLEDNVRNQARLDSIAYPLLASSTALCPSATGPILGLRLATVGSYEKELQPSAVRVLGVSDTLTVVSVTPGSPAAKGGLRARDRILAVGRIEIPVGAKAMAALTEAVEKAIVATPGSLEIWYARDGIVHNSTLSLQPVCAFGTVLVRSEELNAFADGERIYLTSAMMRFANDEELRVVVAHEFAHNAMEHMKARKKNSLFGGLLGAIADVFMASRGVNTGGYYTSQYARLGSQAYSQDFEREADYVGLYALANAGVNLDAAPRFWRRMAQVNPKSIQLAHSHPTTAERFVRMEESIREIEGKQARQIVLLPELKGDKATEVGSGPSLAFLGSPNAPALETPRPASAMAAAPQEKAPAPRPVAESQSRAEEEIPSYIDSEWSALLEGRPDLRAVVNDVRRLGILDDVREVETGVLSAMTGPEFGKNSTEYYLADLLSTYRRVVGADSTAWIDLWRDENKIGRYTMSGLSLFADGGKP